MEKGIGGAPFWRAEFQKNYEFSRQGNYDSTHSANPLACAAGLAVLNEIKKKNLTFNAEKLGSYMITRLSEMKINFLIKYFLFKERV